MSIDEMIAAGKTLPEIQAELRKQVAARDEASLQEAKIKAAREKATAAMSDYFMALGIPADEVDAKTFEDMWSDFESAIAPALKVLKHPSVTATIKTAPKTVTNNTEKDLDWLRDFVAKL